MEFRNTAPDPAVSLFVKNIMVFEAPENTAKTTLPFYADGYPGLLFHQTQNGLLVHPHDKQMPRLFLYGQTIHPIELVMDGAYRLIVFQLYPFVLHHFFGVSAHEINDGCYDLTASENAKIISQLNATPHSEKQIGILTDWLSQIFVRKKAALDFTIAQSIRMIIESSGQWPIRQIVQKLPITPRTFERRFLKEVGVSAKQFAQIIKFQQSLQQLSASTELGDIVYGNGYADQSHFIRVFRAYTGQTPKKFMR